MKIRKAILAGITLLSATGTQAAKMCMPCPAGTYSDAGTDGGCKPCAAGTYQNEIGQNGCKEPPAGMYQNQTGQAGYKDCNTVMMKIFYKCPGGGFLFEYLPPGTYQCSVSFFGRDPHTY
jgi:hypothetical protein